MNKFSTTPEPEECIEVDLILKSTIDGNLTILGAISTNIICVIIIRYGTLISTSTESNCLDVEKYLYGGLLDSKLGILII
ncbi:5705_t:CDS:2 [Funneliformis mosseae]|uniref:5705_t:CDS:1 n=1 Tax=Funneliformis mosseae TaxID=27381 RepID=A0A9N8VGZ6_FUNMO|nr:5705_t:CDS:2 [Funneliformis mosseae]